MRNAELIEALVLIAPNRSGSTIVQKRSRPSHHEMAIAKRTALTFLEAALSVYDYDISVSELISELENLELNDAE